MAAALSPAEQLFIVCFCPPQVDVLKKKKKENQGDALLDMQ